MKIQRSRYSIYANTKSRDCNR